jgi:hypothetical protein
MPTANVNILAVFVAAMATFILGAVWYSPVLFGKQWVEAHARLSPLDGTAPLGVEVGA